MNDISFSITLLGQFLEDIEAYAEVSEATSTSGHYILNDLKNTASFFQEHSALDDIQNANEDLPGKIASLIR